MELRKIVRPDDEEVASRLLVRLLNYLPADDRRPADVAAKSNPDTTLAHD